jgi:kinesin family member C1
MQEKVETHKEIVMRLESKLRESEAMGQRLEKEESKLSNEVMELKAQLTQKDTDLRMTLSSMQEYQRNFSEERSTLRSDLSGLQSRLSQLEEQRVEDKFEVATKREELQNSIKEIASLKETLASVQNALAEREKELVESRASMMQLGIEKEMRMRSEMREESERNERISACAQLLATQYDCANRLKESDEKFKSSVESLQEQIGESKLRWETECSNNQMLIEKIAILEGEINQYKHALENAHANANYEAVAELGRVKGEVEVLRKRISELNEHKHAEGNAATHRIRELETQLAEKDVQRRKLHNLVQELRGNVRVFARVRPFLPDDESYDPTAPPESSITTRHDNCGLRITKKVLKSATDKPEDHTFTFDKVFGQSASQEIVFQEVSEFVQSALDGYHVCLFSCKSSSLHYTSSCS